MNKEPAAASWPLDTRPIRAFLLLSLLDALLLYPQTTSRNEEVRLAALGWAVGQGLAVGLGLSGLFSLGKERFARWAQGGVALSVGYLALGPDVAQRAAKLPWLGGRAWSLVLVLVLLFPVLAGGSLVVRTREALPRSIHPRWLGAVAVLTALALQQANHRFLVGNYPGVHLLVLVLAGLVIATSQPPQRGSRWLLAAGGCGALALLVAPPRGVRTELSRHAGLALSPFHLRLHARHPRPLGGPVQRPPARPPTGQGPLSPVVVLMTVDCLRFDALDTHGSQLPHLLRFRASSVDFREARTTAPATHVSLATMLASRYFPSLRWETGGAGGELVPQTDEIPRFTTLLAGSGTPTVQVLSQDWMRPDWKILEGFSESIDLPREGVLTPAARIADGMRQRLRAHATGPLFLYTHFVDAHAPYDLAGSEGSDRERYVRELALVDGAIGAVLAEIERSPWADRAVVIIAADHGEAFGEHSYFHHATMIYDEVLRIPLWIRAPGVPPSQATSPVSLLDIGPTILDLFRLATPGGMEGLSLLPALRGAPLPSRLIGAYSGRHHRALLFPDGFKVLDDQQRDLAELYNLRQDPGELRNLYDLEPLQTPHLDQLERFFAERTVAEPPQRLP